MRFNMESTKANQRHWIKAYACFFSEKQWHRDVWCMGEGELASQKPRSGKLFKTRNDKVDPAGGHDGRRRHGQDFVAAIAGRRAGRMQAGRIGRRHLSAVTDSR